MSLGGSAALAGVIGWPVGHSRSPRLHGYWLERYGIDGAYVPLAVAPKDFAECLRVLPKLGFAGVNVTVPHKEAALAGVGSATPAARRIGAVNTVIVEPGGGMRGDNTDAYGFTENLRQGAPDWSATGTPAVVLGAGGAARAICVALVDAGASEIRLVNRTASRAEAVARDLGATVAVRSWGTRHAALDGAGLLVNATTLGMSGQPPLEIELDRLAASAVVVDIVYVPLETPLLAAAAARGNRVVDGLGMLLHQARPGFAAWFGVDPEVTPELRAHVLRDSGA